MRAGAALIGAALVAGCGASPAPKEANGPREAPRDPIVAATVPSASTVASEPATRAPRRAALRFELGGRAFPLPVVRGSIAGEPVWMLVDTGANSHVIAKWVAQKAGLAMRPLGEVGSDHTGRAVTAYTVDRPAVAIDDWGALADGPMLVTDVPEPIARIGIGAFVSPQWLAEEGDALVLDLRAREMHTAPWDDAVHALDERGGSTLAVTGASRTCRDEASPIRGLAFVLRATVEGNPVDLLLDTGAHRSDLLTTSRAGRALQGRSAASEEQMYAASGLVKTRLVRGAHVRVGDWSMTTDIDLVPGVADPVCPRDGVVSMDLLGSCTLLLSRKAMLGRCGP